MPINEILYLSKTKNLSNPMTFMEKQAFVEATTKQLRHQHFIEIINMDGIFDRVRRQSTNYRETVKTYWNLSSTILLSHLQSPHGQRHLQKSPVKNLAPLNWA